MDRLIFDFEDNTVTLENDRVSGEKQSIPGLKEKRAEIIKLADVREENAEGFKNTLSELFRNLGLDVKA